MPEYKPRLVIPEYGNPYYNTKSNGGFNPCALGNNSHGQRQKGLNILPNCVGYAVGRFNEVGQYGACKWLVARGNACDFIRIGQQQGLQISDAPTLGGCMVWAGGPGGYGHVAIVERVKGDKIETSESEYYGKAFTTYKRTGRNWSEGCYWMRSSYKYLGCVVNPAVKIEKDEDTMTKEERYAEWLEFNKRHEKELAKQPADEWAVPAIERVKAAGVMGGDPDGNFRPQNKVTRQEMAQTFSNMLPDSSLLPK